MFTILLVIIYVAFISLGIPDSILGSAWPSMYEFLNVPVGYAGIITMIIAACTIISSLSSNWMNKKLGTGNVMVISVALTAAALFGFSKSTHFIHVFAWYSIWSWWRKCRCCIEQLCSFAL